MIDVILGILLTPPVIYILLGLIVLSVLMSLLQKYEEQIKENCLFPMLDFFAMIFRCIMAVFTAIKVCVQHTVYPMKENIVGGVDIWDQKINPYKKKTPYTHIPSFQY